MQKAELISANNLVKGSLASEAWREYDFGGRVYRIDNPRWLYYRQGGSTHRVVDGKGVVHCVPGPGYHGCSLRWQNRPGLKPVQF